MVQKLKPEHDQSIVEEHNPILTKLKPRNECIKRFKQQRWSVLTYVGSMPNGNLKLWLTSNKQICISKPHG